MAYFSSSKDYEKFIEENKIESEYFVSIIKKAKLVEKLLKVIITAIIILWIFGFSTADSKLGDTFLALIIISFIPLVVIKLLFTYQNTKLVELDKIIFDSFLINKIRIFYSTEEANKIHYTKVKHITRRLKDAINPNQIIIELTFEAYQNNVEGLIITKTNKNSIISGSTNSKGKGSTSTSIQEDAEAILINDIKEIVSNDNISIKQDLNYWFELKQKGAITEEEFIHKKKELL